MEIIDCYENDYIIADYDHNIILDVTFIPGEVGVPTIINKNNHIVDFGEPGYPDSIEITDIYDSDTKENLYDEYHNLIYNNDENIIKLIKN